VLIAAAALALVLGNSPLASFYFAVLDAHLGGSTTRRWRSSSCELVGSLCSALLGAGILLRVAPKRS